MTSHTVRNSLLLLTLSACAAFPALADSSHARIVRLSLVQGDVRVARGVRGHDPLADSSIVWEAGELNLPIRQGYVVATDKGRAEVEFENGAMAFLGENAVLEFYDLSLEDGATNTRLVLRQGSASFYVNPRAGDYFSVTGGDFTAEATSRAEFRIDSFDDGSSVGVAKGRINVLRKKQGTLLAKGQSLSVRAGDDSSTTISRLAASDDFDRWVDGRIDSVTTATNAAMQYTDNSGYTSGYADLMTYGSWLPIGGYGFGWRPFGYGLGWCPFDNGGWFFDPWYGLSFVGSQPWGWLPYHYGGWVFEPGIGWLWLPGGFGGGRLWRPSTGVFVRGRGGVLGVVPIHPLDAHGKTPKNLANGVFPVNNGTVRGTLQPVTGADWKVVKSVPAGTLTGNLIRAGAPERLSRTLITGPAGNRVVTLGKDSSIAYDAREHKFVTSTAGNVAAGKREAGSVATANGAVSERVIAGKASASSTGSMRTPTSPSGRAGTPPSTPRAITPPPAPRSYSGGSSASGGSRGGWGGGSSGSSSRGSSHPSSSAGASAGSSHPSSSGGGRPH